MPPRPLSHKLAFWVFVLIIGVFISSFFTKGPFSKEQGKVLGVKWPAIKFTSSFSFSFEDSGLSEVIQNNLSDQKGNYGVYIENLATGDKYGLNENESFPAASLYKLYLMAAVMKEIEAGSITLDSKISFTKSHLIDVFGGVDFGYEDREENIVYTVEEAMQRVGRISDNFAAIMLAEKIGWNKVQNMTDDLGGVSTKIKSPITTTAYDIGSFFKLLYEGKVVSPDSSDKIKEFLLLSNINNRLPAKLPEGVKTVHKTGELSRVRHDAGIVYLEGKPYVIVLMSKDLEYEDDGVELLAEISKDVYEYFKNK